MSEISRINRAPEIIVQDLLKTDWSYSGNGRFETDENGVPKWLHTGKVVESQQTPQITVRPGGEFPHDGRQHSGIHPGGLGPQEQIDGSVDIGVWIPHDTAPYPKTGINPKDLVTQLRVECENIIDNHYDGTVYDGSRELQSLKCGPWAAAPTMEDSPFERHHELTIYYSWWKRRVPDGTN